MVRATIVPGSTVVTEWLVRLAGREWDLQRFATTVPDPWRITDEDGKFYLRSNGFEGLGDAEVKRLADEFDRADLHALLRFEGYQSVHTAEIVGLDPNGSRHVTIIPAVGHATGVSSATAVGSPPKSQPPDLARDTWLLKQRPFLDKALRYVREEPDWSGYWKATEALGNDIGGLQNIVRHGWASQEQYDRFHKTVHHHRHHRVPAPRNQMSEREARSVLMGWLQRCFDWRLSKR